MQFFQILRKCIAYLLVIMVNVGSFPTFLWADLALTWTIKTTSDILEKTDFTRTGYTCNPASAECKFNVDFSDIRPSVKSHHACIIDFGFTQENRTGKSDCDPNEVQIPVGTWPVTIIVTVIETGVEISRTTPFTVVRDPPVVIPPPIFATNFQNYTDLLLSDQLNLVSYTCDPIKPDCRVNFDFS